MNRIFHIIKKSMFEKSIEFEKYEPDSLKKEGFIHCSYLEQVCRIGNSLFQAQNDLLLLEIDPEKTNCKIVDEDLYELNELFPHIYGHLPFSAIIKVHDFKCLENGNFDLPNSIIA